jgi:hypothetical protein
MTCGTTQDSGMPPTEPSRLTDGTASARSSAVGRRFVCVLPCRNFSIQLLVQVQQAIDDGASVYLCYMDAVGSDESSTPMAQPQLLDPHALQLERESQASHA